MLCFFFFFSITCVLFLQVYTTSAKILYKFFNFSIVSTFQIIFKMKNWTNLSKKYVLNDTFVILDTCWQGNLQKTISICQVCLHLGLLVNISSTSSSNWSMNKVKGCFRQAVKRAVLSESMMKTNWAEDTTLHWCHTFTFQDFIVLPGVYVSIGVNTLLILLWCFRIHLQFGIVVYYTVNHVVWDYTLHSSTNWSSLLTYLITAAMLL